MRLSMENGGAILCAESDKEAAFLAGSSLKQKLAYTLGNDGSWQIRTMPGTFSVNYAEKKVFLPEGLSEGSLGYALRIIVDGLALDCGWVPLHAACVSDKRLQVLLFARSGEGKSHFSLYLCNHLDSFRRCGDDHLILSGCMIRGNQSCRQRDTNRQEHLTEDGEMCSYGTSRIGVCIRPSLGPSSITVVSAKDALQRLMDASALKYLPEDLTLSGVEYDLNLVFRKNKREQYQKAVTRSAVELHTLWQICGPFPYIERTLLQIVKTQLDR